MVPWVRKSSLFHLWFSRFCRGHGRFQHTYHATPSVAIARVYITCSADDAADKCHEYLFRRLPVCNSINSLCFDHGFLFSFFYSKPVA